MLMMIGLGSQSKQSDSVDEFFGSFRVNSSGSRRICGLDSRISYRDSVELAFI